MKLRKVFATLLSAMLVFAFAACSNGSSDGGGSADSGNKPGADEKPSSGTPEITVIETGGTVSSSTVVITDDNETAKIAVNENSYYIFTAAAEKSAPKTSQNVRAAAVDTEKGGTWKFYKNDKLVYEGTYKGDISELSKIVDSTSSATSEGLQLELTVTAIADESGDLYEVSTEEEDATFTFEIKSSDDSSFTFEAEIPAVTVSETPAFTGINVGDGPYFVKCGEYYFFSGVEKKWIDWLEDDVEMPDGTIIKIDYTIDGYNINLTKDALDYIMDLVGIDYIVLYKKGVQTALDTKEFDEFKSKLTVNFHYTVKDDIFVILTDVGYMTAKTTGILRNFENNENGSEHGDEKENEEADSAMLYVNSSKNLASINYINSEDSPIRGFTTIGSDHLDGIVHITNTINEIETPSEYMKANGVMGYIFNLKEDDDNKFSFSIAGFRYNQLTQKTEAYVETYKNVTADAVTGSLPAGSHAIGETWGTNDFGFELGNISPTSDKLDIWIDVVANDGVTNGRKGTAGTYTVKFFDSDPKRNDSEDNSVGYTTTLEPLAVLVVAASDVSNPYSSSLADMKSKLGCYASVQGYQRLTGEWQFTF